MDTRSIFSVLCTEPEGDIERHVYPMPLTPENIWTFWNKSKNFKHLFGNELRDDFYKFASTLMSGDSPETLQANGLFWRVDNFVGIFYMTDIQEHDAQIHYTFFDRRHRGRIELVRYMIDYVFKRYNNLHRLSAEIPLFVTRRESPTNPVENQSIIKFIQHVGLKVEGRKREAALYNNEWFDVQCFGILREETEKWVLSTKLSEEAVQV